jgi:hypothetical protein
VGFRVECKYLAKGLASKSAQQSMHVQLPLLIIRLDVASRKTFFKISMHESDLKNFLQVTFTQL